MMPGKRSSPRSSIFRKLSRTSCVTVMETHSLSRSSFRLAGRTLAGITRFSPHGSGWPAGLKCPGPAGGYPFIVEGGRKGKQMPAGRSVAAGGPLAARVGGAFQGAVGADADRLGAAPRLLAAPHRPDLPAAGL